MPLLKLDPNIATIAKNNQTPLSQFNRNLSTCFTPPFLLANSPTEDVFFHAPQPKLNNASFSEPQGDQWIFQGENGTLNMADVFRHEHTEKNPAGEVATHEHAYFETISYNPEYNNQIQAFVPAYLEGLQGFRRNKFFEHVGTGSLPTLGEVIQDKLKINIDSYYKTHIDRIAQSFLKIRGVHVDFTNRQPKSEGTIVLSRQPLGGLAEYNPDDYSFRAPAIDWFMQAKQMNHRESHPANQLPEQLYLYGIGLPQKNYVAHLVGTLNVATGSVKSHNSESIDLVKQLFFNSCEHVGTVATDLLKLLK